ncbi:MAG: hypothetical protein ACIAQU_11490 [Phycisphaerales bacterium JB064]
MNRMARERVITIAAAASGITVCGAAVWWAQQPADNFAIDSRFGESIAPATDSADTQLDASVFDVVLWPEPKQAETAQVASARVSTPSPPPPPPPASINLTLVAIVEAEEGWQVALYDPSEQRIVLAGVGDMVSAVRVREVTASTVLLELAGRTRQLALQGGAP